MTEANEQGVLEQETVVTGETETTPPVGSEETKKDETTTTEPKETPKLVPLAALEDERRKRQDLEAKLAAIPAEPETHFEDTVKDAAFKDYLKNPHKVISDINSKIADLEAVIPDDGAEEYRKARRAIAGWNAIKDEFQGKRIEISERQRQTETAESKLQTELGDKAQVIVDYAKTLGFSEKDLRAKPELRTAVKKMYATAHPGEGKEVKPTPHKATAPGGKSELDEVKPLDTSKMSDEEWFANHNKQRFEKLKGKTGG